MPSHRPMISVVMPVYNASRYLQVALGSITAQTFEDFELIAVNDGSTDSSLEILRHHAARDSRLHVITRPNTGIVGALNDGIAVARGRFVARMDSDDEAAPSRFQRQKDRLLADPGLVAVGSAVTFMDASGNSVKPVPRPELHGDIERALLAGDGGAMIHPAVMFRADAIWVAGGYRLVAQYLEDLDIYLRLARIGTLVNLAESLLRYRVHGGSINFTRQAGRRAVKITVLRDAYAARGLSFDPDQITREPEAHGDPALNAREWACSSLAYGSRRVAIKYGCHAVRLRPCESESWRALRYALTAPMPATVTSF